VCKVSVSLRECRRLAGLVLASVTVYLISTFAGIADDQVPAISLQRRSDIVITIVYDNYPFDDRLDTAWGFSCVIDGLDKRILFDTGGNGNVLLSNMAKLGIDPAQIDMVVLSHNHGDHTGGLAGFLKAHSDVQVFMPTTFHPNLKQLVRGSRATLIQTSSSRSVCTGAWTTGVLGRAIPEQGLYVKTAHGVVVITGCAHPGIVEMAAAAKRRAGEPVWAVMGGFHMAGASRERIRSTIDALKRLGVSQVAPSHCSGDLTRQLMEEAFSTGYLRSGAGARLVFPSDESEDKSPE